MGNIVRQKEKIMKKLLTSVLTLALILCCFTFVGCKKKDNSGLTIDQTLEICEQFILDMEATKTKISSQDYEYPITEAQASAKQVADTDKSSVGIEYSNYDEFDYDCEFIYYPTINSDTAIGMSVKDLYVDEYNLEAHYITSELEAYINMYKDNNWELGKTYKYYIDREEETSYYIRLTGNSNKITIYEADDEGEWCAEYIINLNSDLSWKSFKNKGALTNGEAAEYIYVEKATDNNRIFNKYITASVNATHCKLIDIDEEAQKILCVEKFAIDAMDLTAIQSSVYAYMLNLPKAQNIVNKSKAIQTEVYYDDYYVDEE